MEVIYGNDSAFDHLAFGQQDAGLRTYLANQWDNASSQLSNCVNVFMDKAREAYEYSISSDALRMARAVTRKIQHGFGSDNIRPLTDVGEIQQAMPTMQRWIMANPMVREEYRWGRCDGYSESYSPSDPNSVGEDHIDYRRVVDGIFLEDEDGELVANCYFDELPEGETELLMEEQVDILTTWQAVEAAMKAKRDDPTSPWNGGL
jgi:hypothetical protein